MTRRPGAPLIACLVALGTMGVSAHEPVLIVGGGVSQQSPTAPMTPADASVALTKYEEALLADPDNLGYGNDYRMLVIKLKDYDRCIGFFASLVSAHPETPNAYLNYAFAYVDKIPDAGAVSQLILANKALPLLTKTVELRPSWLAYATRGISYMYWPRVFNRTPLAIADLEEALKIQKTGEKRAYHVRTYISLGDAHWKMDHLAEAKALWREGLAQFSDNAQLRARLDAPSEDGLRTIIVDAYDPNKRIDTNVEDFLPNR